MELETRRLRLRGWRDGDVEELVRLNGIPAVVRYLTPGGTTLGRAETELQLARFRRHWAEHGFGVWAVEDRGSGRFLGRAGLAYHRLWPEDPEVGWKLDPAAWGRGYATEAGAAALAHAFGRLGLDRVVSIVHPENARSLRVAHKLGLRPWRRVAWPEGGIELEVRTVDRQAWESGRSA